MNGREGLRLEAICWWHLAKLDIKSFWMFSGQGYEMGSVSSGERFWGCRVDSAKVLLSAAQHF